MEDEDEDEDNDSYHILYWDSNLSSNLEQEA
jgi:hypothetical protein